jgi:Tol biopolymer transport system component
MFEQVVRNRALAALAVFAILAAACSSSASVTPVFTAAASSASPTVPASLAAGAATPAPSTGGGTSSGRLGQIVFFDDAAGSPYQQVYIEAADGSGPHPLVVSQANDLEPALSPDGTKVVFSRGPAMFVVKVDGTGLEQIDQASCGSSCASDDVGGWSPDGTKIVFTRALSNAAGAVVNVGIWVTNADGSDTHQVTLSNVIVAMQDDAPSWSPDGKRLAFQRDRYTSPESNAIFTVAIDGTDLRQVTPWTLGANDPAWSPDGTLIAFQSPAETAATVRQHIYTVHPDGTDLVQLTADPLARADGFQGSNHPSWSPDGSQIVFAHFPGASLPFADLFVMNRDGSNLHLLADTPLRENWPDWGPAPSQ